jgi:UDP-N-acetylmuramoyl-tripeptide--D-alanyl-D-alanine ligase
VGRAHIGELGSQAKVAEAKEEIYLACPKAIHVFNMDNEWTIRMQSRSHSQQICFSAFRNDVDVHFRAQRLSIDGLDIIGQIRDTSGHTWVHVLGRQNTGNLMCAASLALTVGVAPETIWKALANIKDTAWGRNQVVPLTNGARLLFDAYNANPDSMTALLKNLYEMDLRGRKFLVIGDMKELGQFTAAAHEEAGARAASVGFEGIWYVGENSKSFMRGMEKVGKPKMFISSPGCDPKIANEFAANLKAGDIVAVKGSRSMQLEKAVENWPLETPLGKKP